MTDEEIEKAMLSVVKNVEGADGGPEWTYHPDFGWVNLKTGEGENIEAFKKFMGLKE
jgi:hypothetical protein